MVCTSKYVLLASVGRWNWRRDPLAISDSLQALVWAGHLDNHLERDGLGRQESTRRRRGCDELEWYAPMGLLFIPKHQDQLGQSRYRGKRLVPAEKRV